MRVYHGCLFCLFSPLDLPLFSYAQQRGERGLPGGALSIFPYDDDRMMYKQSNELSDAEDTHIDRMTKNASLPSLVIHPFPGSCIVHGKCCIDNSLPPSLLSFFRYPMFLALVSTKV